MGVSTSILTLADLRDGHAQQKYRDKSRSKHKDTQDVSHLVSLEIIVYITNKYIGTITQAQKTELCQAANSQYNMRMESRKQNRSKDKLRDNHWLKLASEGTSAKRFTIKDKKALDKRKQLVLAYFPSWFHIPFVKFVSSIELT